MSQIGSPEFTVHNVIRNYLGIGICGGKQVWAEGEADCNTGLRAASAYWVC